MAHEDAKYAPLNILVDTAGLTSPVFVPELGTTVAAPFGIFPLPAPLTIVINSHQRTNSYAGFGQGTVEVLPQTHLTAGVRYTVDKRALIDSSVSGSPTVNDRVSFDKTTWKATLDHNFTPDILVYAQYSTGFKSGLYNLVNPYQPAIKPETIGAIEVGLKSELFDNRVRFNASIFHYALSQVQVTAIVLGNQALFNAASATSKGGEAELEWVASKDLTLRVSAAYDEARFTNFPGAPLYYPNPIPNPNGGPAGYATYNGNDAGATMPNAPKWMFNGGANYETPTSVGNFFASTNITYTSRTFELRAGFHW